jgi:hypothetical protein
MLSLLLPFQLVLLMFSGWVNRHQLDVIEYLQEENRVLKAHGWEAPSFYRRRTLPTRQKSARARAQGVE